MDGDGNLTGRNCSSFSPGGKEKLVAVITGQIKGTFTPYLPLPTMLSPQLHWKDNIIYETRVAGGTHGRRRRHSHTHCIRLRPWRGR